MDVFDDQEEEASGIVFRDTVMLALVGFITALMLVISHIRPEAKAATAIDGATATMPGSVMIEANWPAELDADIDLWVQGPGDVPVGYSNKGGVLFNLLRDDLGKQMDVSGQNYEVAYSRGLEPGEYVVNLHLYRNRSREQVVPVKVVASVKTGPNKMSKQILVSDLKLDREGLEKTVFRFTLNRDGTLKTDSVNTLYRPLRSGTKS